jgi:hypothetical protein
LYSVDRESAANTRQNMNTATQDRAELIYKMQNASVWDIDAVVTADGRTLDIVPADGRYFFRIDCKVVKSMKRGPFFRAWLDFVEANR